LKFHAAPAPQLTAVLAMQSFLLTGDAFQRRERTEQVRLLGRSVSQLLHLFSPAVAHTSLVSMLKSDQGVFPLRGLYIG